jgi:hypothetical protein
MADGALRHIWLQYKDLKDLSERARYKCPGSDDPVCQERFVLGTIMDLLAQVKDAVEDAIVQSPGTL